MPHLRAISFVPLFLILFWGIKRVISQSLNKFISITYQMFLMSNPLDGQKTKLLKTKTAEFFYKQQTVNIQIVSKKSKITVLF